MNAKEHADYWKKSIAVVVGTFSSDDYHTLDQLWDIVREAQSRIEHEQLTNVSVDWEHIRGYYDDVTTKVTITGRRMKTPEEIAGETKLLSVNKQLRVRQLEEELKRLRGL